MANRNVAPLHPGSLYGELRVISVAGVIRQKTWYLCRCSCGAEKQVRRDHLVMGRVSSCGCQRKKWLAEANTIHGHNRQNTPTRTYSIWQGIIERCCNKNSHNFLKYGARGIAICDRWRDFRMFLLDMGEAPEGKSIDRIDNTGNYEPGNCRWATIFEQARNKRSNRFLEYAGERLCVAEWAVRLGIQSGTLHARLARGEPLHMVLSPHKYRKRLSAP